MLDLKLIRENIEAVRQMLADRHTDADLDRLVELDTRWRENLTYTQSLQAHQKQGLPTDCPAKKAKTGCDRDYRRNARALSTN